MQAKTFSRNANIEIKGIATLKDEVLTNVLKSVGEVIEEPTQESVVEV